MPRTTVDIDASVLRELKQRAREDRKSLGQVISEIAAGALKVPRPDKGAPFRWTTRQMDARVDLRDKEAVQRALDAK